VTLWLETSGLRRWVTVARLAPTVGSALLLLGLSMSRWARQDAGYREPYGTLAVIALLAGLAAAACSPVIITLLRCRVCGLHVMTSAAARARPRREREAWLIELEACPVCGDDGSGSDTERSRWLASGRGLEEPYWSWQRLLVALLGTLVLLAGSIYVGSQVRP